MCGEIYDIRRRFSSFSVRVFGGNVVSLSGILMLNSIKIDIEMLIQAQFLPVPALHFLKDHLP